LFLPSVAGSAKVLEQTMTLSTILILVLGATAGGFVNGLAGTGTALFSLGIFLMVLPPISAVAIVAVLAIVAGVPGLWLVRSEIKKHKSNTLCFLLPGLLGVPVGVLLLDSIDVNTLLVFIGTLLVLYGGYFSASKALPVINRASSIADVIVGFISGILGGLASLSGAIPVVWLSMRPWSKNEIRGVLQPFNVLVLLTTVILLFFKGAYNEMVIKGLLVTLPVTIVASQVGVYVFDQLSDNTYRRLLIGMSFLMGLGVLISTQW